MRLPLRLILAAAVGVGFGFLGRKLSGRNAGPVPVVVAKQPEQTKSLTDAFTGFGHDEKTSGNKAADTSKPLRMRGYAQRGKWVNVILSDGRTLTETDSELGVLSRHSVMVEGKKVFLMQPDVRVASAAVVESKPAMVTPARMPEEKSVIPPFDQRESPVAGSEPHYGSIEKEARAVLTDKIHDPVSSR